jgi:sterol desaturase/sphingolipid hydroxylase (fatty acid hydroxylase superfamily)
MAIISRDTVKELGSSTFNYWFGYVSNLALVAWLTSHAWQGGHLALPAHTFALLAFLGLLSWTLSEYLLHRYVYHVWKSFLSTGHDLHHQAPKDKIGVPWYITLVIIVALYEGLAACFNPITPALIMAFNWLGYIGYCITHHASHHWPCRTLWLRQMKRHHSVHHAFPDTNWGFTTSLWDYVFGTHYRFHRARVQQSRRDARVAHHG